MANEQFSDMNLELKSFGTALKEFDIKLDDKIEVPALKPIWKNFERFALYEDFKDLYNKTLPEIIKFE